MLSEKVNFYQNSITFIFRLAKKKSTKLVRRNQLAPKQRKKNLYGSSNNPSQQAKSYKNIMKKNLLIHFGIHRTGTTTLQGILKHNANALRNQGILYPQLGHDHDHSRIAWGIISNKITPEKLINDLNRELNSSTETIILSHEDFSLIHDKEWLNLLKNEFNVKAVIYLRRQDLWLESWYNQHIKWPWTAKFSNSTPEFFLENIEDFPWIDYARFLQSISEKIEKTNIYTNVVDSLGVTDTAKDFLGHINAECDIPENLKDANASISMARIDILRRINIFTLKNNNKAKAKILTALKDLEIPEDNGSKIAFTDEQVKDILEHFEKSNTWVAKEFFQREQLFGDPVKLNRSPIKISDYKAYRVYIPRILKKIASEQ